jgi:hypothetical protein
MSTGETKVRSERLVEKQAKILQALNQAITTLVSISELLEQIDKKTGDSDEGMPVKMSKLEDELRRWARNDD